MKIEKNIPIPTPHKKTGVTAIFRQMEVGDSVWIESEKINPTNAYTLAKYAKIKIATRREGDGYRMWGVE